MSVIDELSQINPDAIIFNGYDDCIIGYGTHGMNDVLIYDREKMIKKISKMDNLTYEDALEFFEFNIACAYMGEHTPIIATIIKKEKKSNRLIDIL